VNGGERSQLEVLDAKVDALDAKVMILLERDERDRERALDHENRIRQNEKWRYGIPAAVIMGAASLVAAVVRTI